jgi:uncharacterized protein involved in response to NO
MERVVTISHLTPSRAERPPRFSLFQLGFRPFFLLAGIMATLFVPLWLLAFFAKVTLPTRLYGPSWHAHEMVFGFSAAVIAGFLLTAVRNWTNRPTPSGAPLAALSLLWVLGRVAILFDGALPIGVAPALDLAFLPAVAFAIARPIVAAKSARNYAFIALLAILSAANAVFHTSPRYSSAAVRLALDVIVLMVFMIGGRVIPMFTANALRVETRSRPSLDRAAIAAMLAMLLTAPLFPRVSGALALTAGVLNGARLVGWRSLATRKVPILWILHVGYAWIALGLVLRGIAAFVPTWISTAPTHALAVGAVSTMILGMMTRVSLGHTGRFLVVSGVVVAGYVLLTIAALARAIGPLIAPSSYAWMLVISGIAWTAAFATFVLAYLPILIAPRVDGKPG